MSHHHFTLSERIRIQVGIENNISRREIANQLGVTHTAINQEVKNNSIILEMVVTSRVNKPRVLSLDMRARRGKGEVPKKIAALASYQHRLACFARGQPAYDAEIAQTLYLERRSDASYLKRKLLDGNALTERITEILLSNVRDSPEQIAANLRKEGIEICCQTIYNWIKCSVRQKELVGSLRRRGKKYRYSSSTIERWNKSRNKRSIHNRPVIIEQLTRYGDLEGDTIFGLDTKDRLLSHVDRVTGLLSLSLILGYDSYKVHKQTYKDVLRVFGDSIHTITYDNGNEFSGWQLTERELGINVYFADPYRSSQRGRNENTNGLVRDYFPKGTDFKKITRQQVQNVESILNNRSRKRYNWRNPIEQRQLVLAGS